MRTTYACIVVLVALGNVHALVLQQAAMQPRPPLPIFASGPAGFTKFVQYLLRNPNFIQRVFEVYNTARIAPPAVPPPQTNPANPAPAPQTNPANPPTAPQTNPANPAPTQTNPANPAPPQTNPANPAPTQTNPANPAPTQTNPAIQAPAQTNPTNPAVPQTNPTNPAVPQTNPTNPAAPQTNPTMPGGPFPPQPNPFSPFFPPPPRRFFRGQKVKVNIPALQGVVFSVVSVDGGDGDVLQETGLHKGRMYSYDGDRICTLLGCGKMVLLPPSQQPTQAPFPMSGNGFPFQFPFPNQRPPFRRR